MLQENFDAKIFGFGTDYTRHEMNLPREWEHYFAFTTVRNPYTRFASLYKFYYEPEQKRIESILDIFWARYRLKPIWDCLWEDPPMDGCVPIRLDAVLRLESLQDDFNALPFVDRFIQLPRWNYSQGSALYGRTLQQQVQMYYAKDFIYFGYDPYDISMCELRYL